jgi:hypothetical protein
MFSYFAQPNLLGSYVPITPPGQEGWTRHHEDVAKLPVMERTGWLFLIEEF